MLCWNDEILQRAEALQDTEGLTQIPLLLFFFLPFESIG